MKKNEKKKRILQFKKNVFSLLLFFWLILWLCISNMICEAWEGTPIAFKSLKMEKNWERSAKVYVV